MSTSSSSSSSSLASSLASSAGAAAAAAAGAAAPAPSDHDEPRIPYQEQRGCRGYPCRSGQSRRWRSSRTRPCSQQRSRACQGSPSICDQYEPPLTLISTLASAQIRVARETMSSCFSRVDISSQMAMVFSPTERSQSCSQPSKTGQSTSLVHSKRNVLSQFKPEADKSVF